MHKKKIRIQEQSQESGGDGEVFINAAWEANMFKMMKTYQVNAVRFKGFFDTEVLLDNQADISIMKPGMLCALCPVKDCIHNTLALRGALQVPAAIVFL
jgi:hypothetical protein